MSNTLIHMSKSGCMHEIMEQAVASFIDHLHHLHDYIINTNLHDYLHGHRLIQQIV